MFGTSYSRYRLSIEGLPLVKLTSAGITDVAQYSNIKNANITRDADAPTTENVWVPLSVVRHILSGWVRADDRSMVSYLSLP